MSTNKHDFILTTVDDHDSAITLYVAKRYVPVNNCHYFLSPVRDQAHVFDSVFDPDTVKYQLEKCCKYVNINTVYLGMQHLK